MARIVHCHPGRTSYAYHVFTDLDFWDARKIVGDLASVRRNFSQDPPSREFPTQVVSEDISRSDRFRLEKRLKKALVSPPRHIVVEGILNEGFFEFDPLGYYPDRWSKKRILYFTIHRLPLDNAALSSPYQTVCVEWRDTKIRVEKVKRKEKYDPLILTKEESRKRLKVPACF